MRIKLSEFRKSINKFLQEAIDKVQEDHTAHSKESGYTDEVEEDIDRLRRAKDGYGDSTFDEAAAGVSDPNKSTNSATSSAALHTRDKSKMQGVGPRPTLATAFGDQPKKETLNPDGSFDKDKTSELPSNFQQPNAAEVEKQFNQNMKSQFNQFNKEKNKQQLQQVGTVGQRDLEKLGWKFTREPNGNWSAIPPSVKK